MFDIFAAKKTQMIRQLSKYVCVFVVDLLF